MELCSVSNCTYIQLRTHTLETVCCVITQEFALFLMRRGFFIAACRGIILSKSAVTRAPTVNNMYFYIYVVVSECSRNHFISEKYKTVQAFNLHFYSQ